MPNDTPPPATPTPKKSVALCGVTCRQYRAMHRRAHRQRPRTTAATTSSTLADACGVRGDRQYLLDSRQAAQCGGGSPATRQKLRSLRGMPNPRPSRRFFGADPRRRAPDGRHAHRRFGARHRAAGEGRPRRAGCARHRRSLDGVARFDAALLVPLEPQRTAHRRRDGRRFHRRPFPASPARREAQGVVGEGDAHVAQPLRRA